MKPFQSFLAASLLCATAGPAFAHAMLMSAQPAVGSTLSTSPHQLTLHFSEGVVAKLSGVTIRDGTGKAVATGLPVNDAGGSTSLHVPIAETLRAGTYKVTWHAISVDTHRTQGSFSFTVAP